MKIFERIAELSHYLESQRKKGKIIGLVPTMGALHQGHAQLLKEAKEDCDLVVCSVFVNPTQFNNKSDFEKYPSKIDEDKELLIKVGCDVLFCPTAKEMYPDGKPVLNMDFGFLETVMEGKFRPGHFSGVGVVVSKLLNIVQPNRAYFGQKDLQQLAVIKRLVKDLNIQTEIVKVATVRESGGLALSSRNLRLSSLQKEIASNLYRIMNDLKTDVTSGADIVPALERSLNKLGNLEGMQVEYLEVVDSESLKTITQLEQAKNISVCAAAYLGEVRLIDNLYLKESD